jgi:hypothetical protein
VSQEVRGNALAKGRAIRCYVSMISRAEQRTVWINAYNAAMTGLLSAKAAHMERYTENNVSMITEQCKALADQALKDLAAHASDMLE